MRISQKLDYACRALVYLARQYDGASQTVARADDIAETEAIPSSFLAQILNELKRTGLVTSRRGKTGGWRLATAPAQTTLLAVVQALEPESLVDAGEAVGESGAVVSETWASVQDATRQLLQKATLEELAASSEPMFYI